MNKKKRLLHLHHCQGIGYKSIDRILLNDPSLQTLYTKTFQEWKELLLLPTQKIENFYRDLHSLPLANILQKYENSQIDYLTLEDPDYPCLLKEIYDPPHILYLKGKRELLTERRPIAVIGTRKPTAYGTEALKSILPTLIKKDVVIVSGMAIGVDSAAHLITLKTGGKTIAVLGGGILDIYPKQNKKLAADIAEQGLLISEMTPFTKAEPWMFPMRNRIISGLSIGVFVVEAKIKSGSLITAKLALDQNREVFALPGTIFSSESQGTNRLIQEGAKMVLAPENILEELPVNII
ncbi:DNA-processing protein DprA [Bacillus massiliglaciei]|uniref:DNA-processing protein DprA n=1 Tax=Bacillus massiliglaciei TaxID=1816693 RepID=UPI000B0E506C|nr:DNA-processing protein DprA [Bacillus massiliglaciei]